MTEMICTFCEEPKDDNAVSADGETRACGDCRGWSEIPKGQADD